AHGVGDGTFAPAVDSRVVPYVIEDAAALDFDGDGKLDVVARSGAHAYVLAVFRGRGDGTLDDATYIEPTRGVVAVAPFGGATFALGVTEDPNDAASAEHVAIFDAPCK
ncbi:MAG TPA: VCBS repeat-containing protein, partial [Labilithrix sp.]